MFKIDKYLSLKYANIHLKYAKILKYNIMYSMGIYICCNSIKHTLEIFKSKEWFTAERWRQI